MPREQGESGEFVETIAPEDALEVFDAVDGPVILSADVADHFGVTRETARRKLQQLYDRGELDRRKVSRRVIYWRAGGGGFDAGDLQGDPETTLGDENDESGRESDPVGSVGDRSASVDRREDAVEEPPEEPGELVDAVRAYLEANDLPPKTDHGRGAVIDVLRYLREHGTAGSGELQDAVHPSFEDNWSTPRTMWNAIDRYLEDVPGVEKGGYGEWTYTGDDAVRAALEEG